MNELVFDVTQEADGGYCTECLTESIVTEGNTWEEVRGYYFDQPEKMTSPIRLRLRNRE